MQKTIITTIISFSLLLSQQLQVDGNLKVTGEIDAQGNAIKNVGTPQAVTDALNLQTLNNIMTDDTQYEYLAYKVRINPSQDQRHMEWIQLGDNTGATFSSNFIVELNNRSLEGYQVHSTMNLPSFSADISGAGVGVSTHGQAFVLFILKRPISEE